MDIEQYTAGCLMFSVDDYFKKLVTNHSVRLYTRLLSYHGTNEAHINHYAFCFLQRMCSYRLEQTVRAPAPPCPDDATGATPPSSEDNIVTLGHMLFNINTLVVFNDILSDTHANKQKALEPLLRLIKAVVRILFCYEYICLYILSICCDALISTQFVIISSDILEVKYFKE